MSGRRSRDKGASFERTVAKQLREWSSQEFRRTKFSDGPNTATPDIITPPRFRPVIECKNREGWSWCATIQGKGPVWDWNRQAVNQAGVNTGDAWLILTRNRQPVFLVLQPEQAAAFEHDHQDIGALAHIPGLGCVYLLSDVLEATDYEWWCG